MLLWIYGITVFLLAVFFLLTVRYRLSLRKTINKKKHKLLLLYGMAMFLADKPLKKIVGNKNYNLDEKLQKIYAREHVDKERYFYSVSKIAMVLLIIIIANVFGMVSEIKFGVSKNQVNSLERNNYGEGEKIYDLDAAYKNSEQPMQIVVQEKELTRDEAIQCMEKYKEALREQLKGENESLKKVTRPLNFVPSIGDEGISIIWDVENDKIIEMDGSIGKDIPKDGCKTKIYAKMTLDNTSIDYGIDVSVYPISADVDIGRQVQATVDEQDCNDSKVVLPESLGDKSITYYKKVENISVYFLPLGIITAIIIFFGMDKDLDKNIKERNMQLKEDYSEIVSKIMLLTMAGMSIRNAWQKTIDSCGKKKNHYVYCEMRLAMAKINSGMSELRAYELFGERCGIHCYIKFSSIINQNLKRGSNDMCRALEGEMQNALEERKNSGIKRGEESGTKLLAPMIIMLIIGIAIIVTPAFMSIRIDG